MPFIWDDFDWKWVNSRMPYDKSRYVVARKLRVKPTTDPRCTLPFTVDSIRQHSEHFGHIESIEMLPGKETEAHVTFVRDRSAFLMQSRHDDYAKARKMYPFQIQPADTWEQPRENANPPPEGDIEQTADIFRLNEDCLLHMFKFLDIGSLVELADVCKLFNRLLHRHCFPRVRAFKVDNTRIRPPQINMPLAKMRRTLRCIGPFITDLIFEFDMYDRFSTIKHDVVARFLEVLVENVGTNIRRAWIYCRTICENDRILILAPILRQLEMLQFEAENKYESFDIDFHGMCPNLVDIEVDVDVPMRSCVKPWPSLRRLAVINSGIEIADFLKLIQLNPQLTQIEFVYDPEVNIPLTKLSNMRMLEKVKIKHEFHFFSHRLMNDRDIVSLSQLQHLTEISLINLFPDTLNSIIDCLANFVGLRKIHLRKVLLESTSNHSQSLIQLAVKQPNLKEMELIEIDVTQTDLMAFVRFAVQLEKLLLSKCRLEFTDQLILDLVDVLKSNRRNSNNSLELTLDSNVVKRLNVIESELVSSYLRVKSIG